MHTYMHTYLKNRKRLPCPKDLRKAFEGLGLQNPLVKVWALGVKTRLRNPLITE